jgi:hypothetical protein
VFFLLPFRFFGFFFSVCYMCYIFDIVPDKRLISLVWQNFSAPQRRAHNIWKDWVGISEWASRGGREPGLDREQVLAAVGDGGELKGRGRRNLS